MSSLLRRIELLQWVARTFKGESHAFVRGAIVDGSSRESSRVALMPRVNTGFKLIPSRVNAGAARPTDLNHRFEIFSMSVNFSDPSCKKGNVFGIVSLLDTDGLLADGRLPLNDDEHGYVAYFYREWYDTIRISNTQVVHLESPTPCHLVPFSSVLKIYTRFVVTTADKCILMCNCSQPIDLSDIWVDKVNLKRGTLQFKGDDGEIDMDYIALKNVVDTTIELRLDESHVSEVSGCIPAYYEKNLITLMSLNLITLMSLYEIDTRPSYLKPKDFPQ